MSSTLQGFLWGPWLSDIYCPGFKLIDSPPGPEITEQSCWVTGLPHSPFFHDPRTLSRHPLHEVPGRGGDAGTIQDIRKMLIVWGSHKKSTE